MMADEKLSAVTPIAAVATEDLLYLVDDPGGTPVHKQGTIAQLITLLQSELSFGSPLLHVREQETSGTEGPNAVASTFTKRDLNTVITNTIAGASLASAQITLPAGTYRIKAKGGAFDLDRHKLRLRNVSDGTTAAVGSSELSNNSDLSATDSTMWGRFTIAAEKVFELQHYAEFNKTGGFGTATSSGEVEVYAELWIEKE